MRKVNRFSLKLGYDGRNFCGWQVQPNQPTVQQSIQDALTVLLKHPQTVLGCGRTDSGVHASCFYAHWDAPIDFELDSKLIVKLNALLPKTISIYEIKKVENSFHARFSATQRHYKYFIHFQKNPFYRNYSYEFLYYTLDVNKMKAAAELLLNFSEFKPLVKENKDYQKYNCTLSKSQLSFVNETQIVYEVSANRFLHNMVRRIVGALILIGRNKLSIDTFEDCMKSQSELPIISLAPANGLQLAGVDYKTL